MKEAKAIEILNKMRDGIKEACECGLTSSSEKRRMVKRSGSYSKNINIK